MCIYTYRQTHTHIERETETVTEEDLSAHCLTQKYGLIDKNPKLSSNGGKVLFLFK